MKKKKWYKLKPDVVSATDPVWAMIALLFEALNVRIEDERLKKLPFPTRFLFEEIEAPKVKGLTKKVGDVIN